MSFSVTSLEKSILFGQNFRDQNSKTHCTRNIRAETSETNTEFTLTFIAAWCSILTYNELNPIELIEFVKVRVLRSWDALGASRNNLVSVDFSSHLILPNKPFSRHTLRFKGYPIWLSIVEFRLRISLFRTKIYSFSHKIGDKFCSGSSLYNVLANL